MPTAGNQEIIIQHWSSPRVFLPSIPAILLLPGAPTYVVALVCSPYPFVTTSLILFRNRSEGLHSLIIKIARTRLPQEKKQPCGKSETALWRSPIEAGTPMRRKKDCINIMTSKVVSYQRYASSNFQVETFWNYLIGKKVTSSV